MESTKSQTRHVTQKKKTATFATTAKTKTREIVTMRKRK